jgi:cobalt-precorrin-5B (C1)-methyltransferase
MNDDPTELRRGWTTGACATAAVKAALSELWGGRVLSEVEITLPRGETPVFAVADRDIGDDYVRIGITKDAGDDPDVTHGALILVTVREVGEGVVFKAGNGVGTVTKPGLPIAPGEPAINPVPRKMMRRAVWSAGFEAGRVDAPPPVDFFDNDEPELPAGLNVEITISIPGGEELATKTWNPRLGIKGGLSVLGTTGIVRPFSCAAWIASIHRGIDVARATGLTHVAGCTGATSEASVRKLHGLSEGAMLDMGDFAGGVLKYLRKHPVERVTIGGGIGKMAKLAQGALDLHSGRSQVDFDALSQWLNDDRLGEAHTALEAYQIAGVPLAQEIAKRARLNALRVLGHGNIVLDVVVIDREGAVIARAE